MATKKGPFAKPAASQHRIPAFYFRGGDILREREYLADEYRKALANYRRAQLTLHQIEAELAVAAATLSEREGVTNALTNFLDADAEGNRTEQDYKQRLMRAESEINEVELQLQQARAVHHPAVCASLQKEKAYWQIEVQRAQKALDLAREQSGTDRNRLVELTISRRYQTSWDLETKVLELSQKNHFLRRQVNRYRKECDAKPKLQLLQTDEARTERAVYGNLVETEYSLWRADEKRARKPGKWGGEVSRLLQELEDLNGRMADLGMPEEDFADVDALRAEYRPPQHGDGQEQGEKDGRKQEQGDGQEQRQDDGQEQKQSDGQEQRQDDGQDQEGGQEQKQEEEQDEPQEQKQEEEDQGQPGSPLETAAGGIAEEVDADEGA
jgi:hypothetical protein